MDKIKFLFGKLEENLNNQIEEPSKRIKAKTVGGTVCRYWLEKRCKKGESCEYLHEYIPEKLPECPNVVCRVKDCPYKHTPKVIKECQFYLSGYCKDGKNFCLNEGKNCKSAHIKKELCINYTLGFCPDGKECKYYHLRSLINPNQDNLNFLVKNTNIV
jgi:cleavage and polyadenylation specificity factor subunit 4